MKPSKPKAKMGRPSKGAHARTQTVALKLTAQERAELARRAKAAGVQISVYLRQLVMEGKKT